VEPHKYKNHRAEKGFDSLDSLAGIVHSVNHRAACIHEGLLYSLLAYFIIPYASPLGRGRVGN
jgi:hypothetical protein